MYITTMSKSNIKGFAVTKSAEPRGSKPMLSHLAKLKGKPKKMGMAAIINMLYIMADNGRKSGRASGNVYQRNGRVRQFVVPALVQNSYTTAARALLAQFSQGWNALSDGDRASWLSIDWLFKSDRFGNPVLIKGKAAYVMLNVNLTNIAAGSITSAPLSSEGVPGITDLLPSADQSAPTLQLGFFPDPTDLTVNHLIFATAPLRAGVSHPRKSDFRLVSMIGPGAASPFNVQSDYETKYGNAWRTNAGYVGGKIFFKAVPINNITGVEGGNIIGSCVISA